MRAAALPVQVVCGECGNADTGPMYCERCRDAAVGAAECSAHDSATEAAEEKAEDALPEEAAALVRDWAARQRLLGLITAEESAAIERCADGLEGAL